MQYTLQELRQKIFSHVLDVYSIFQNHYGEDFTDLQGLPTDEELAQTCSYDPAIELSDSIYNVPDSALTSLISHYSSYYSIYIYWPHVTITNEHDRFIDIWDLYARVDITIEGRIPYEKWGVLWNRSHYNTEQFLSNFMHSHIRNIPKDNLSRFMEPCLGNASIRDTIITLKSSNDPVMWMLFCEELSRAVTVESLTGHPWKHLEEVGMFKPLYEYGNFTSHNFNIYNYFHVNSPNHCQSSPYWLREDDLLSLLRDFTVWYLSHGHPSFCFQNDRFCLGLPYYDYIIDLSNAFISFYNQYLSGDEQKKKFLFDSGFLVKAFVVGKKFGSLTGDADIQSLDYYIGQHVLTFKGRDITLQIDNTNPTAPTPTTIINHEVAMHILNQILKILNFRFNGNSSNIPNHSAATSASHHTSVCYL